MTVTLTTKRLLHMLKEAYKAGAIKEACKDPVIENLEGVAETTAQSVLNKYQWEDDFIQQQT
jgi:hypothetical protein